MKSGNKYKWMIWYVFCLNDYLLVSGIFNDFRVIIEIFSASCACNATVKHWNTAFIYSNKAELAAAYAERNT